MLLLSRVRKNSNFMKLFNWSLLPFRSACWWARSDSRIREYSVSIWAHCLQRDGNGRSSIQWSELLCLTGREIQYYCRPEKRCYLFEAWNKLRIVLGSPGTPDILLPPVHRAALFSSDNLLSACDTILHHTGRQQLFELYLPKIPFQN